MSLKKTTRPPTPINTICEKHVLANGLTILTEEMPHLRFSEYGACGSRAVRDTRTEPLNGRGPIFLEHMLFKGTKTTQRIADRT